MNDDLQRMLDERACERLITDYTHLVDFGNAPGIADLFVEDGRWYTDDMSMDGPVGIRDGFTRRQGVTRRQSRHVCTNMAVTVEGDTASGLSYLVNYRHDSGTGVAETPAPAGLPKYVGQYHDTFVRTAHGWRFKDRYFVTAFLRPTRR
jgi:ketosteroid isomerase-like protein